jgi:tRNA pseudouridine38-40 synthase
VRIRIDLAYDGTQFHGWASQPDLRTVQDEVERALSTVVRAPVSVTCAGRTDTGVHARGQVVHCDVAADAVDAALERRLNGLLPPDVRVRAVAQVGAGFDARFSPLWRRYCYRVADSAVLVDPLMRTQVVVWPRELDLTMMNTAAEGLLGVHDFAAFCKRREGATTIRELLELSWNRDATGVAVATARADAFCHHLVRSLMGCLLAIGDGRRQVTWAGQVLAAAVRDPAVTVAPAHGLTLEEVAFPSHDQVAAQAELTRRVREW